MNIDFDDVYDRSHGHVARGIDFKSHGLLQLYPLRFKVQIPRTPCEKAKFC